MKTLQQKNLIEKELKRHNDSFQRLQYAEVLGTTIKGVEEYDTYPKYMVYDSLDKKIFYSFETDDKEVADALVEKL